MVSFPQVSPPNLCAHLFLHTCHMPRPFLDFMTRTILGEQYRLLSSSLCNFLHSPVTPALLGPNIPRHPQPMFLQSEHYRQNLKILSLSADETRSPQCSIQRLLMYKQAFIILPPLQVSASHFRHNSSVCQEHGIPLAIKHCVLLSHLCNVPWPVRRAATAVPSCYCFQTGAARDLTSFRLTTRDLQLWCCVIMASTSAAHDP